MVDEESPVQPLADVIPLPKRFDGQGMCEFHDDGTVTLALSEGPVRLRRPVFNEFRRIRERHQRIDDDVTARLRAWHPGLEKEYEDAVEANLERYAERVGSDVMQVRQVAALAAAARQQDIDIPGIPYDDEAREVTDKINDTLKERTREHVVYVEDQRLGWVQDVVGTLADREVGDAEWEPWMTDPDFCAELVTHFTTRPFRRSPSG